LAWNQRKVRQLTPGEIWLFIIGRVLAAFGLGIIAMQRLPRLVSPLGWPAAVAGVVLLVIAGRGMLRRAAPEDGSRPAA
jgi:hypothetical protein